MKINFLTVVFGIISTVFITTSCLKDDETTYEVNNNASITAFSIPGDIDTKVIGKTSSGADTTLTITVDGSEYPFAINQGTREIYNVDPLPFGTDVSRVVVNITADTQYIFFENKSGKDSLWQSTDSLDFTNPIVFKVYSLQGVKGPSYTARINVYSQVPDSLSWSQIKNSNFSGDNFTKQKAITFNNRIYVFGENGSETNITSTLISDGVSWTTPSTSNLPSGTDYSSAMVWNGAIYIIANNKLYKSSDATNWTIANQSFSFAQLIGNYKGDSEMIYAISSDNKYLNSSDGTNWIASSQVVSEQFPKNNISYVSSPLSHNNSIYSTLVIGDNNIENDTTTVVWSRYSDGNIWTSFDYNNSKNYLPKLANIRMIGYNNSLYAFGGEGVMNKVSIEPFSYIFTSTNNGVSWQKQTSLVMFPKEFTTLYSQSQGNYSCVVDSNDYIWIMWSKNGEVWRGRVNRLGFNK